MDIEAEIFQTVDEALDVPGSGPFVEVIGAEIQGNRMKVI